MEEKRMSRYTDLMKKERLSEQEENELFELVQEEFGREERRLGKLPINEETRQECLWNVVNAHRDLLDKKFANPDPDVKLIDSYLDLKADETDCKKRMFAAYRGLVNREAELAKQNDLDVFEQEAEVNLEDAIANAAYVGHEGMSTHEIHDQGMIFEGDDIVQVNEKRQHLMNEKETEAVSQFKLQKAVGEMSMKKCAHAYSIEGDKTITDEQKKALYQFHHWMRKHNATAPIKWAGFGYKGSAVDFSERFMRLPARVQLKALYLVETDKRKNPNEDVDNIMSQGDSYVPNYDKLKKKMTSNFLFARKYLNGSRYLWDKLEQATNLANEKESVESLKKFSDAKKAAREAGKEAVDPAAFFIKQEDNLSLFKIVEVEAEKAKRIAEDPNNDKETRKQGKEDYKNAKKALQNYDVLCKHLGTLVQLQVQAEQNPDNAELKPEDQKKKEIALAGIDKTLSELKKTKIHDCLKNYQHYFFKQTNDLGGYTAISTGFTQSFLKLTADIDVPYVGESVNVMMLPSALMNCVDSLRKAIYGDGAAEKALGVTETVSNLSRLTSRVLNVVGMGLENNEKVGNWAQYLGSASTGINFLINSGKAIGALYKSSKASSLKQDFDKLEKDLKETMKGLKDQKTIEKLEQMKKKTVWSTLNKASKLIRNDKRRERNSCLRKWLGATIGVVTNAAGYVKNLACSIIGVGGTGVNGLLGAIDATMDNLAARDRNREYIDTEYPITNAQRMAAIRNYENRLNKCPANSEERKEIESILASREKLDNRIRNMNAGNRFHAHQEGLRNEISESYTNIMAKEGEAVQKDAADIVANYENRARELMARFTAMLGTKKPEEKAAEPQKENVMEQENPVKRNNSFSVESQKENEAGNNLKRTKSMPVFAK